MRRWQSGREAVQLRMKWRRRGVLLPHFNCSVLGDSGHMLLPPETAALRLISDLENGLRYLKSGHGSAHCQSHMSPAASLRYQKSSQNHEARTFLRVGVCVKRLLVQQRSLPFVDFCQGSPRSCGSSRRSTWSSKDGGQSRMENNAVFVHISY